MSASEMLRRFIDTLEEGARLRRMDYGAVNTASLGKRRRPPGSGWDSAAPPTMPRTGGRPPPRDDDEDAFLDDDERERRDAMREMGRWSEDQLRDFLGHAEELLLRLGLLHLPLICLRETLHKSDQSRVLGTAGSWPEQLSQQEQLLGGFALLLPEGATLLSTIQ